MVVAAIASVASLRRGEAPRARTLLLMNRFFGGLIGTMTIGHLLAITVKMSHGTLAGSPLLLYALGIGLGVPAWFLVARARTYIDDEKRYGRRLAGLNAGIGAALLAIGLHHLPLAAPAAFNVLYQFNRHRMAGRVIVGVAVAFTLALFVGGVIFMASGLTFEEFTRRP